MFGKEKNEGNSQRSSPFIFRVFPAHTPLREVFGANKI